MNIGDLIIVNKEMIKDYEWLKMYQAEEPFLIVNQNLTKEQLSFYFKGVRKSAIKTYMEKKFFLLSPTSFIKREFKEYFIKNNV